MNKIHHAQEVSSKLRSILITEAERIAEKYPQYKGYFNDHLLVVAVKPLKGRYDDICEAGEVLLAAPEVLQFLDADDQMRQSICIWDAKTQTSKYVPYADVEFVERNVRLSLRLDY